MGNIISSTTTPHPVIINRIDQQKDGVVKPSSSKENAKEKTFDGGADNGVVKRKRRKKGNLRSSSSSMANPKDAVGQPHKKIYSSFSSPSYYSSLADPEALTIDGGADNQQKDEVLKPSSSTENAKEKTFGGGAAKNAKEKTFGGGAAKNAKEKTFDGGADNQQKNAVVKPSSSTENAKEKKFDGGIYNPLKVEVVKQGNKKYVVISSSAASSMANAKENLPPIIQGSFFQGSFFQPRSLMLNEKVKLYRYPTMTIYLDDFKFVVIGAQFNSSEVIVIRSKHNNTGKTTFLRLLAGLLKPDTVEADMNMPQFNVSYMPQKINPAVSTSTVRRMLQQRITDAYNDPYFVSNVMQPLLIEQLLDQQVVNLSLGECQRVELCLCLGKPADIYLIDEPTAYLDPQLRMAAVKAIKGFIHHANKTAFLVEPDLEKPEHFADRVILFQGTPTLHCSADIPQYFFWDLSDEQWLKQRSIPEGKIMRNTGTPTLHCSADFLQYFGDLSDEQWLKQRSIPEGKIMRNTV